MILTGLAGSLMRATQGMHSGVLGGAQPMAPVQPPPSPTQGTDAEIRIPRINTLSRFPAKSSAPPARSNGR